MEDKVAMTGEELPASNTASAFQNPYPATATELPTATDGMGGAVVAPAPITVPHFPKLAEQGWGGGSVFFSDYRR